MADLPTILAPTRDNPGYSLSPTARAAVVKDNRRIVITGAGGWLGRATLDLLARCMGPEAANQRVHCFGTQARQIKIGADAIFPQRPIEKLRELPPRPTLLLHLAFLTKDKVAGMDVEEYRRANRSLSQLVLESLDAAGVDRLFIASSGAASFSDAADASPDFRLYGQLKRDDELMFADWAKAAGDRRTVIARIYSLSGPFINKHNTYALASFILDALRGGPISIRSPSPVTRNYVAIRELMSLVFNELLVGHDSSVVCFDSGGMPIELGDLAHCVSNTLGPVAIERVSHTNSHPDYYFGNDATYRELLAKHRIEPIGLPTQILETAAFLASQLDTLRQ